MIIDLDRLHRVIEGRYNCPESGNGKTFAQCHQICQSILVTGHDVLWVVPHYDHIYSIHPELERVADYYGMGLTKSIFDPVGYVLNGSRIRFLRKERLQDYSGIFTPTLLKRYDEMEEIDEQVKITTSGRVESKADNLREKRIFG